MYVYGNVVNLTSVLTRFGGSLVEANKQQALKGHFRTVNQQQSHTQYTFVQ